MEKIYDHESKSFNFEEFHKGPTKHLQQSMQQGNPLLGQSGMTDFAGLKIDTTNPLSALLGWAVGNQFDSSAPSGCLYTIVDTINTLNYFQADVQAIT
jgi:hypothetical protein